MADASGKKHIYWFSEVGIGDVPVVGGKNASLGEMFSNLTDKGVAVPDGFAISAPAYEYFVDSSGIKDQIHALLQGLDIRDLSSLSERGEKIRRLIREATLPADLEKSITDAYDQLCERYGAEVDTAVRSSATAEDLPDASFAGQQDTYLNVHGHENLLESCRACFASLFTDRAIAYREEKDFDHFSVALSIAVQKMVRSDLASAGVMFSIDTESGFRDAAYVTGGYGLGENVVQGSINPDEWYVHKPSLNAGHNPVIYAHLGEKQQKMVYVDPAKGKGTVNVPVAPEDAAQFCLTNDEVLQLARWAVIIEDHYGRPMDMEWAKDGQSGDLFIVQARPETVVSRRDPGMIRRTVLEKQGPVLAEGMAVGELIGTGRAAVIKSAESIKEFKEGDVLVTEMTDPDWVPIMKIASAIVTDSGGRTCHAAIISRELGIPCVVGTGNGSKNITHGEDITVSCAGGAKGVVYRGILPYNEQDIKLSDLTMPSTSLWYQQSDPDRAFPDSRYPHGGVGLVRVDELIRDEVKVHPRACLEYPNDAKAQVDAVSMGYADKKEYFVSKLAMGVGRVCAASTPKPVRVMLSDGTTAEMDKLIGGKEFSYNDANPFMGLRGAGRYTDFDYEEAIALELDALARVRNTMGLTNMQIVLPPAQTAKEAAQVISLLEDKGLGRGNGMEYHMLCRSPAQMLTLEAFKDQVDGFLINVGELAQLVQGIDTSNVLMRPYYSEQHPAVISLIDTALDSAKRMGKSCGLVNISPGNMEHLAGAPFIKNADYLVIRPDVFLITREHMLNAEK